MELKFDPNQDFQIEAVNAVADLFEGQRRYTHSSHFEFGQIAAQANHLELDDRQLLDNLRFVQKRSFDPSNEDEHYVGDPALLKISARIETAAGPTDVAFPNYSVEMETGTGKTYVYLRTALELFRRYGMRKFIIVVPSVAIREGVIKTFEITRQHFKQLYDNTPYRFYAYDSRNLSQVRNFALSDSVEFMVMTLAAFNKADINVINQSTDRLQGETPIYLVQATRPILILDEPQNMESEGSLDALARLHPLFALRYSATHRNPYNIVYRLSPAEAYRRKLVKRIEVASTQQEGNTVQPYIRLLSTDSRKQTVTARLAIHKLMRTGKIQESRITVRQGDSLQDKSGGRQVYAPFDIADINVARGTVTFANDRTLHVDEEIGGNKAAIFEAQIRYTIEEHFRKQAMYSPLGVKVLSLFFIDRVDNYAGPDPLIRDTFDRVFDELRAHVPGWRNRPADAVRAAYFAQRTTRSGDIIFEDTKTGKSAQDREAYELIMKEKERLLSLDEPTAFIFSHSALREGWDNPNVFQICTLNQSISDMRKRQEVGRGIRLAVNQNGERLTDERVNILTVVANESYEQFVRELQSEIDTEIRQEIEARFGKPLDRLTADERKRMEREYGTLLPPPPGNARERAYPSLQPHALDNPEFQRLWDRISRKTRYSVQVDTEQLVADVVRELQNVHITEPRIAVTKIRVGQDLLGAFQVQELSGARTLVSLQGRYPLPNLVDLMANLMENTSPPMRLTRRTLLEIVRRAPNPEAAVANPNDFAAEAVRIIKQKLSSQLIDGLQYHEIDDWYEQSLFKQEIETWQSNVEAAGNRSLYDQIVVDSGVERSFVKAIRNRTDVSLFVKLPNWFKVPTPIGNYNPDWAIVINDPKAEEEPRPRIYLVAETKGQTDVTRLQFSHEQQKITCGRKHFEQALAVPYVVAKTMADVDQAIAQPLLDD